MLHFSHSQYNKVKCDGENCSPLARHFHQFPHSLLILTLLIHHYLMSSALKNLASKQNVIQVICLFSLSQRRLDVSYIAIKSLGKECFPVIISPALYPPGYKLSEHIKMKYEVESADRFGDQHVFLKSRLLFVSIDVNKCNYHRRAAFPSHGCSLFNHT